MCKEDLFKRIEKYVRDQKEERGIDNPVSHMEIAEALNIDEEQIMLLLAQNAETWSLIGDDLYVDFLDDDAE